MGIQKTNFIRKQKLPLQHTRRATLVYLPTGRTAILNKIAWLLSGSARDEKLDYQGQLAAAPSHDRPQTEKEPAHLPSSGRGYMRTSACCQAHACSNCNLSADYSDTVNLNLPDAERSGVNVFVDGATFQSSDIRT